MWLVSLDSLQEDLRTRRQGVYLAVVHRDGATQIYVGSSYGKSGLGKRVFQQHMSATYRSHDKQKGLYHAMDKPGALTRFVPLVVFPESVSMAQVFLTEAGLTALFRTYKIQAYRKVLPTHRNWISFDAGLNRSNPLGEAKDTTIGLDVTKWMRLNRLNNCKQSGPWWLIANKNPKENTNGKWRSYAFILFSIAARFSIPIEVIREFDLEMDPNAQVWVIWDLTPQGKAHAHRYAAKTKNGEEEARLGLRIFRSPEDRDAKRGGVWLQTGKTDISRLVANWVVDFLEGKALQEDYVPGPDRRCPFQTKRAPAEGAVSTWARGSGQKRRITADFDDSQFTWGENKDLKKRPRTGTKTEALDSENVPPTPETTAGPSGGQGSLLLEEDKDIVSGERL